MRGRTIGRLAGLLAGTLLTVLWAGCTDEPTFDPATRLTPEAVAQDLLFRYQSLSAESKALTAKGGRKREPMKGAELAKSGESGKKAETPATADALLDDIVQTIRKVQGTPPREFCKKVAEAVRKDTTADPKGRDDLAKRLDEMAGDL